MSSGTITAANAVYMLTIPNLFPVAQQLQGFAADDLLNVDAVDTAEVVKGVDGYMSAGFLPYLTKQSIMLQADSDSGFIFDQWIAAQKQIKELYPCNASVLYKSIGRRYTHTNGILTSYPVMPSAGKVLKARTFVLTWDNIEVSPA